MKLIKNSTELIDPDMVGLKSFEYCFNSSDSSYNSRTNIVTLTTAASDNNSTTNENSSLSDIDSIINQNITYEYLQTLIEDQLIENDYYNRKEKLDEI
jgi:hypothetical protein